ncbi:YggT family protein [bacterium]|nr:YggT family protein [bacterium]
MEMLVRILQGAIELYILLIIVWSLGSFNPSWRYAGWYRTLESIIDPYISLFRGMRLQVGMFDLSPMLAVAFLSILSIVVGAVARNVR